MSYGCFDRQPLKAHRGRDGYWCDGETLTIKAVQLPQTMEKDCQYRLTEIGKADPKCVGCEHKNPKKAKV